MEKILDLKPENFNSVDAIQLLVNRKVEEN